jgi:hypothetical protein
MSDDLVFFIDYDDCSLFLKFLNKLLKNKTQQQKVEVLLNVLKEGMCLFSCFLKVDSSHDSSFFMMQPVVSVTEKIHTHIT